MKRALPLLLAVVVTLSGCTGLPRPREMGDMALLRAMGVDRGEEGVSLTVSTGPRAKGLQGEQQPALTLSAEKPSLSAASLAIQGLSDRFVSFGYVDQLLLGEELARQGVKPVLDWFARDTELSLSAQIWVVQGKTAKEAVESGGDQGVESRLATLCTDGAMGVAAIPRTAGEVYTDLLELGTSYAPALSLGDGEGTSLLGAGYGVWSADGLAGFLTGDAAAGLELLAGKPSANVVECGDITVRVYRAATTGRFLEDGRLSLTCRVWGRLAEYDRPPEREEFGTLSEQVRLREESCIRGALEKLRGWEADCLGLGAKAAMTAPALWQELQEDWLRYFGEREPEVTVEVELVR